MRKLDLKSLLMIQLIIVTGYFGCQNSGPNREGVQAMEDEQPEIPATRQIVFDSTTGSIPIFYNMYLTVDISTFFAESSMQFESSILNPSTNIDNYLTSYKKALNIGTYAVDLSYVKMFDEFDYAGKYFSAMHKLSEGLGIPNEFFYEAAKRFEKNMGNRDSISYIANEIYTITDNYLKENGRENTAALVVVGGWIEAVYLAFKVYQKSQNIEVLEKIADQKHSLPKVLALVDLSNDQNEFIVELIDEIKMLVPKLDTLSNSLNSEGKSIPLTEDFKKSIMKIRTEIVN